MRRSRESEGGSNTVVIGETTHTPLRKSMSRPTSRSKQIVSTAHVDAELRLAARTTGWLFFFYRSPCYVSQHHDDSEANEITILYSLHQFSKTGYPDFRLTHFENASSPTSSPNVVVYLFLFYLQIYASEILKISNTDCSE